MAVSAALWICLLLAPSHALLSGEGVAERILVLLHRVGNTEHTGVERAAKHAKSLVRDIALVSGDLAVLQNSSAENDPDEWKAVSAFHLLHQRMSELDAAAGHVTSKIEWALAPLNLATHQHTMAAAHEDLMAVLKAKGSDEAPLREHFVEMYDKIYSGAVWRLYDALIDTNGLGPHNLANSTRVLLKNDALAISICYDVFFRQLLRGIALDAAYSAFEGLWDPNSDATLWLERFHAILAMAKKLDKVVRDSWAEQFPKLSEEFVLEHRYLPNQVIATQLQSYLSALYGQRLWFVLVYSGEEGVTKRHSFDTCGGWRLFDKESGKAVAVRSLAKSDGGPKVDPQFYFHGAQTSRWGFYLPFEKIARKIFDRLGYSCTTYSLQAVVESKADPVLKGPPRHIAKTEVLIRRFFASNKLFTMMAVV